MTKKKLKNNILENIMIGVCILIILILIYLIYKKLSNEENFRFQTLKGKIHNNSIENYNNIDSNLKDILNEKELSFFKNKLKQNINDPKFIQTIKILKKINKNLNFKEKKISARILLPLKNDIDIENSLKRSLQNPKNVDLYLKGEFNPIKYDSKIVTAGDTRYIIDGHNRWCEIYLINPHCQIDVVDFVNIGLTTDIDFIKKEKIKGINIYDADEKFLKDYINKNITNDVIQVFKNNGYRSRDDVITYILGNIKFLKTRNKNVRDMYLNAKVRENFKQENYQEDLCQSCIGGENIY